MKFTASVNPNYGFNNFIPLVNQKKIYQPKLHIVNNLDKAMLDYLKFFTSEEGADMLPYAYLADDGQYDDLIKNCKDYYPFHDEVAIIKNNKDVLSGYLNDIDNIIEIGPGSNHTLANKTLPMLSYAKNLKNYFPLDHCSNYLKNIVSYINEHTKNINIEPIKANMLNMDNSSIKHPKGKNCVLSLGITLGNFDNNISSIIINQLAKSLNKDDLLIMTLDSNRNINSLGKAYDNSYLRNLIFNVLKYYSNTYSNLESIFDFIKPCYKWNNKYQCIEMFFKANKSFSFDFSNHFNINVKKNQELYGIRCYKYSIKALNKLFNAFGFEILETITSNNKIIMFICKKV